MSAIVVEQKNIWGIPRLSDVKLGVYEEEETEEFPTQEYFCPQGHSFSLLFQVGTNIPGFWECPKCETISPNYPL